MVRLYVWRIRRHMVRYPRQTPLPDNSVNIACMVWCKGSTSSLLLFRRRPRFLNNLLRWANDRFIPWINSNAASISAFLYPLLKYSLINCSRVVSLLTSGRTGGIMCCKGSSQLKKEGMYISLMKWEDKYEYRLSNGEQFKKTYCHSAKHYHYGCLIIILIWWMKLVGVLGEPQNWRTVFSHKIHSGSLLESIGIPNPVLKTKAISCLLHLERANKMPLLRILLPIWWTCVQLFFMI